MKELLKGLAQAVKENRGHSATIVAVAVLVFVLGKFGVLVQIGGSGEASFAEMVAAGDDDSSWDETPTPSPEAK